MLMSSYPTIIYGHKPMLTHTYTILIVTFKNQSMSLFIPVFGLGGITVATNPKHTQTLTTHLTRVRSQWFTFIMAVGCEKEGVVPKR